MNSKTAEIIAIGDELVSGQRLDTNSQWISAQLGEIGIEPQLHSCVGDSLSILESAFHQAAKRSDFVIVTGGIGPTKDDLTRQVLAKVAGVELEFHPKIEDQIRAIFAGIGREMPENNSIQAYFPAGSHIIPNAEGTAPGIDITIDDSRMFALPGVPYEMKQMWADYVAPVISQRDKSLVIRHHVVHCFGMGESQVELMLDGMTERDHVPRVGITASQATISLRITAVGKSEQECNLQIKKTCDTINQKLGDLVFGENGVELSEVIISQLTELNQTIAITDFGFGGSAGVELLRANQNRGRVVNSTASQPANQEFQLEAAAQSIRESTGADIGVAISPLQESENKTSYQIAISNSSDSKTATQQYGGHSGLRQMRTTKQILNQIRHFLRGKPLA